MANWGSLKLIRLRTTARDILRFPLRVCTFETTLLPLASLTFVLLLPTAIRSDSRCIEHGLGTENTDRTFPAGPCFRKGPPEGIRYQDTGSILTMHRVPLLKCWPDPTLCKQNPTIHTYYSIGLPLESTESVHFESDSSPFSCFQMYDNGFKLRI